MDVTIENGVMVIKIKMDNPPKRSASGKTLVVASSRGNVVTTAMVQDKPVVIGLNAYIQP